MLHQALTGISHDRQPGLFFLCRNPQFMDRILKPSPFLRWAGGKTQLLPELKKYLPKEFKRYHEPFLGGGALFFSLYKENKQSIISDMNRDLINTYKAVRDHPSKLIEKLKFHERYDSKSHFQLIRSMHHVIDDPISRAARFFYLNHTCFNGLYRENKKGEFNNSYGNRKFKLDINKIYNCSAILQATEIKQKDFEKIKPKRNDFVYFDPPYHKENSNSFTRYTKSDFTVNDHLRLKKLADKLNRKGVKWMLSNSDSAFIRELYSEYRIHKTLATRHINPKSKNKKKSELIITNY